MPNASHSRIRQLAAPYEGPRFAAAEFAYTVSVWDLKARKRVSVFDTPLDSGGHRLAINPRGDICAIGSYEFGGLACYAADSGEVISVRDDFKRPQRVGYSPDGKLLYCAGETGPLRILDAETCKDLASYPSTDKVFFSPHQPIALLSKRGTKSAHQIRMLGGKRIANVARETFAILDAAFGPDRVCVAESAGPVRCLETGGGDELWRYDPRAGCHVLRLAYCPKARAFFGVEWRYTTGGRKQLLRFDTERGNRTLVATFAKQCAKELFCSGGEFLLTTEGELIDVMTGVSKRAFRFPLEN
jgi:WD40 repeat protein